ncbi:hypothetical protein Tco_1054143 [Tanacetum coccineum]|uniref:Uncharacterized protein n=1 Tax=Tanacetum coccineum TaxID=301880 RepID=A0ABQ5GVZ2_9ASTR
MDDPNITMEEYIRLEEEKARKRGKVFNWETAKYGKIWYDEDIHDLRSVETEFPSIAFNNAVSSEKHFLVNPRTECLKFYNLCVVFVNFAYMALPPRDQRHQYLRYEGLQYTDANILDFESRLTRIYMREVHRVQIFDFGGLSDLMADRLSARMLIKHRDAQGFIVALGLHTREEIESLSFVRYWAESTRQILDKEDLRNYWIGISSARDFLSTAPSYTTIRAPILKMYHRLIACSIARNRQAPEKVIVTDLFYLRGMDVVSVNVPNLLARYLRLFAAGRKSGAHIFVGQFVASLVEHSRLLTAEILQGLTVISLALPIIDMAKLVRLQICVEIDDRWAWAASGPERQQIAAVGTPEAAEDAPAIGEGGQADPAPVMAKLEEYVCEIRGALTEQGEVIDAMARDFSRFSTWAVTSLARMMDRVGVTYTSYYETPREYQRRRVRQTTGEANTITAQQDQQQPDP